MWTFYLLLFCIFTLLRTSYQTIYWCNSDAACGCSSQSAVVTKIVGGEDALENTWGWAVTIIINRRFLCGGALLSGSWVLTAAHCVYGYDPANISVYAGGNLLNIRKQMSVASSIIVHQKYNTKYIDNDIALIHILHPFNMTDESLAKICLPSATEDYYPPDNSMLVAVGWGRLEENGELPTTLQQVTLQTVPYESSSCSPWITNPVLQFCAGFEEGGKDTCQGDSGGPLMMFSASRQWTVVGIVSKGYGCAQPGYAGVYTRVVSYLDWIHSMSAFDGVTVNVANIETSTAFEHVTNKNVANHRTTIPKLAYLLIISRFQSTRL